MLAAVVGFACSETPTSVDLQIEYSRTLDQVRITGRSGGREAFTPRTATLPPTLEPIGRGNIVFVLDDSFTAAPLELTFEATGAGMARASDQLTLVVEAGATVRQRVSLIDGAAPGPDAGVSDVQIFDTGSTDVGFEDVGPPDGAAPDAGRLDTGDPVDADLSDTGPTDADLADAGPTDTGPVDTGPVDAEPVDSGPIDGGVQTCGDGVLDPGETCDDGDQTGGDGCDTVCNIEIGWVCARAPSLCFEDAQTAVVSGAAANCPATEGVGSDADPFCTLNAALGSALPNMLVRSATYAEALDISGGMVAVVIVAEEGAVLDGGRAIALTVGGGATATVVGLQLRSETDAVKIHMGGTTAALRENTIGPSGGLGVDVKNGTLVTLERNLIRDNEGGGLKLDTDDLYRVVNNIIVGNGEAGSMVGGVYIKRAAGINLFSNNTLADNLSAGNQTAGVRCDEASVITNSIVWGNLAAGAASGVEAPCTSTYSDLDPDPGGMGTNFSDDPLFTRDGRYHLMPGSPCVNAGDPAGTMSSTTAGPAPDDDFDGDRRIGLVDVGADELR